MVFEKLHISLWESLLLKLEKCRFFFEPVRQGRQEILAKYLRSGKYKYGSPMIREVHPGDVVSSVVHVNNLEPKASVEADRSQTRRARAAKFDMTSQTILEHTDTAPETFTVHRQLLPRLLS